MPTASSYLSVTVPERQPTTALWTSANSGTPAGVARRCTITTGRPSSRAPATAAAVAGPTAVPGSNGVDPAFPNVRSGTLTIRTLTSNKTVQIDGATFVRSWEE